MTTLWIITEGMAGTENQCLGVAQALGIEPALKRIGLRQPWKSLSPWLGFECAWSFTGDPLTPPWPDILLTSGRKSIAAARYIKRKSGGKTFTAQIQDPRINPKHFDLVAVPEHDPTRGNNVLVTTAAPNLITKEKLNDAAKHFAPLLSPLPKPRIAVMIGGNSKAYTMTPDITDKLANDLSKLADQGYGLMVTASRRTGEDNLRVLKGRLQGNNIIFWDGHGENPYFGFLAYADYILVTADSVSMLSEAATTGKPAYMIPLDGGAPRINHFHENLKQKGIMRAFSGMLDDPWAYDPLNDAGKIADAIRAKVRF